MVQMGLEFLNFFFYFLFTIEIPLFLIKVLDELRLFNDKKVIFYEKKNPPVCHPGSKFVLTISI
jgi:hypothetical protein